MTSSLRTGRSTHDAIIHHSRPPTWLGCGGSRRPLCATFFRYLQPSPPGIHMTRHVTHVRSATQRSNCWLRVGIGWVGVGCGRRGWRRLAAKCAVKSALKPFSGVIKQLAKALSELLVSKEWTASALNGKLKPEIDHVSWRLQDRKVTRVPVFGPLFLSVHSSYWESNLSS